MSHQLLVSEGMILKKTPETHSLCADQPCLESAYAYRVTWPILYNSGCFPLSLCGCEVFSEVIACSFLGLSGYLEGSRLGKELCGYLFHALAFTWDKASVGHCLPGEEDPTL